VLDEDEEDEQDELDEVELAGLDIEEDDGDERE
jgi:hypothetical protein